VRVEREGAAEIRLGNQVPGVIVPDAVPQPIPVAGHVRRFRD